MNEIRPPREPIRQALFQRSLEQALQLPPGYSKVAVLIIRWDESIDDFKERHTKEVSLNAFQAFKILAKMGSDCTIAENLCRPVRLHVQSSLDSELQKATSGLEQSYFESYLRT